jgi:hypothetical protein
MEANVVIFSPHLDDVVQLDDDAQRRKAAAMRTYRTQFAALDADGRQRLTRPELIGFEVVWSRPAS